MQLVFKNDMGTNWTPVESTDIPISIQRTFNSGSQYLFTNDVVDDYTYINCYDLDWELENGQTTSLIFDSTKASERFLDVIRKIREPLFAPLDIAYMQALESGNQTTISNVVSQKQQLRDCTDIDFSNVQTLDDIKVLWPETILGTYPEFVSIIW